MSALLSNKSATIISCKDIKNKWSSKTGSKILRGKIINWGWHLLHKKLNLTNLCDWNLDTVSVGMEACFGNNSALIVWAQTVYFQPWKYILKRCMKTTHLSTSVVEVIPHGVNKISLSFRQHARSKSPYLNHRQPSIMHICLPLMQGLWNGITLRRSTHTKHI